jgi:hypothetical protein
MNAMVRESTTVRTCQLQRFGAQGVLVNYIY